MGCCKEKITQEKTQENEMENIEDTQFKLRSKITFSELSLTNPSFKVGEVTDEIVLNFLKINPNRISLFSEYPTNWMELIEGETEVIAPIAPVEKTNIKKKRMSK